MILRHETRADWLKDRQAGLGSSDIATIVGANPYRTPYELWAERRGITAPKESNFLMELGHKLEPVIADLYQEETKRRIQADSIGDWMYVDDEFDFLRASPDRLFVLDEGERGEGILEIKSTSLNIDPDNLPRYWFCQLQYQMGIGQKAYGSIAYLSQGRHFGYQDFAFNPKFYDFLKREAINFWQRYIIGGEEPPLTTPRDYAIKYRQHTEGKTLQADAETLRMVGELRGLNTQIKALELQADTLREQLKIALLDSEALVDATGATLLTYKTSKPTERIDTKRLRQEHPEIAEAYIREGLGVRTLRLK